MQEAGSKDKTQNQISRRRFFKTGGIVIAGGGLALSQNNCATVAEKETSQTSPAGIVQKRLMGRTGFEASDISMGCGYISEANVVRYAYDRGVNLFDTAEGYGNGDSETKIGQVMSYMDRKKIFIVTKLVIKAEDTETTILERFGKCRERLKTDYVDALFMHAVYNPDQLNNRAFHDAVAKLKADGRLKHAGLSCHGPRDKTQPSMEEVLLPAVDDGRFDVILLVANFLNEEAAKKVIRACKKNHVGTMAMKVVPGLLQLEPFDPDNPAGEYAIIMKTLLERGLSRDDAIARIKQYIKNEQESQQKVKPFAEKYGLKTNRQLQNTSVKWALRYPDLHTLCISMRDFDMVDQYVPLSGTKLARSDVAFLRDFRAAYSRQYCRHGCAKCFASCRHGLPVSTIMRYAYYFECHGREKLAMQKYARLDLGRHLACVGCDAPCEPACPYGVGVRAHLLKAHGFLSMA